MNVVTRFAPSPTGHLHIGGARTALFCWAWAKKNNGKFLLRIEDTDKARSKPEYETEILDSLRWLGLNWDGEIVRQSARSDIYSYFARRIESSGLTYIKDGAMYFDVKKIPFRTFSFKDLVCGDMSVEGESVEDFVLLKSDGYPTFHLANVVDDIVSGVTYVVRGSDHIANTFKHDLIYYSLREKAPFFAHMPLISDKDGKPLSKRDETQKVTVTDFRKAGFLPKALINYIALLGWSPSVPNLEKFDLNFIGQDFDFSRVGKTNARFDYAKLLSFNGDYIRELPFEEFKTMLMLYSFREDIDVNAPSAITTCDMEKFKETFAKTYHVRSNTLRFPFEDATWLDSIEWKDRNEFYSNLKVTDDQAKKIVGDCVTENGLDDIDNWVCSYADKNGLKRRIVGQCVRYAVTGKTQTPPLSDVVALLGKDVAKDALKGFSYKE